MKKEVVAQKLGKVKEVAKRGVQEFKDNDTRGELTFAALSAATSAAMQLAVNVITGGKASIRRSAGLGFVLSLIVNKTLHTIGDMDFEYVQHGFEPQQAQPEQQKAE